MRQFIPFGDWTPDLPPLGNQGALTADNVLPDAQSYTPFPTAQNFSFNTLAQRCQGAIIAQASDGNTFNFAGDSSALYQMTASTFVDVTRAAGSGGAYTTLSADHWDFVQFGERVYGVNGVSGNQMQALSLGEANFVNLTSGEVLRAHSIAQIRDFVVIGNIHQITSTSGTFAQRVRWCAVNNPTSWTPDAATLADFQDLVGDGGPVMRVIGGEYGVILERRAIYRMTFVGSPLVFQFDNVQRNIGLIARRAAISYQNLVFFLADDGFYIFDGSNVIPIGRGRVDKTFFNDLDFANVGRITTQIFTDEKVVLWAYPNTSASGGNPNRILAFNWAYNRWSRITSATVELITSQISAGATLNLAGFDSAHRMVKFNGSAMPATIDTGEFQLFEGERSQITEVWPYTEGFSASAQVAMVTRNRLTESITVGTASSPNATGFAPVRSQARYHRVRLTTAANVDYEHLAGVAVEGDEAGTR